jgi:FlaA1/EpsC-like NDP-sugar epimerase
MTSPPPPPLADLLPVRGDLDDVEAMTRGMSGCAVVYHAAAATKSPSTTARRGGSSATRR